MQDNIDEFPIQLQDTTLIQVITHWIKSYSIFNHRLQIEIVRVLHI